MVGSNDYCKVWQLIRRIVESRGRELVKYEFFEELWRKLFDTTDIILVKAPTGAGKTEAVLVPFLLHTVVGEHRWSNTIYALPTRSLVTNMYERICRACETLREPRSIAPRVTITYDYGGFLVGKPFLEGDIVITTYDTLLYAFYGFRSLGHHVLLSLGKIAGSLVILDEIQLLQDTYWYSLSLLPHHVVNLARLGATVVVMSATLPRELESGIRSEARYYRLRVDHVISRDKPQRGRLNVSFKNEALLDMLNVVNEVEKPALLIFNTVERAADAFRRLRERGYDVELLHSRLRIAERRERESAFERGEEKEVIVATQVVEAGLDYDFRTVLTEIAPIDALIQRLGRCARRRDGSATIFIADGLTKHVYPDIITQRTRDTIDGKEKALSEAVSDVRVAEGLINSVYTHDLIEELRKNVESELERVRAYIKPFLEERILSARDLYREITDALVRLGTEVKSILLLQEDYSRIVSIAKQAVKHAKKKGEWQDRVLTSVEEKSRPLRRSIYEYLEDSMVSLSLPHEFSKRLELPALMHEVGGENVYMLLTPREEGAFRLVIARHLASLLRRKEAGRSILVLNPHFYEIYRGYELGVVKPYGT